ncbi:MAG: endonuclease domain-containing protein [Dehalococcoidia bacterium]|nr:endonuclease domain-containing protein [Dehalococcoidia bacterium]
MNRTVRARHLRKNLTDAEQGLWNIIRNRQVLGYRFRRQAPIGPYIVDFVCFENRLVIEVDGGQHLERADYDAERTAWLESAGFRVVRFWNNQVLQEKDAVREAIFWRCEVLHPHPSLPPWRGKELRCVRRAVRVSAQR